MIALFSMLLNITIDFVEFNFFSRWPRCYCSWCDECFWWFFVADEIGASVAVEFLLLMLLLGCCCWCWSNIPGLAKKSATVPDWTMQQVSFSKIFILFLIHFLSTLSTGNLTSGGSSKWRKCCILAVGTTATSEATAIAVPV